MHFVITLCTSRTNARTRVCARALKRRRRRRGTRSFGARYKCSDRNAAATATARLTPAAHCRSLPPPSPRSFSLPRSSARRRNKRLARYPFRDSATARSSIHARCFIYWSVCRARPLPWFLVSYRCGARTATWAAATVCGCVSSPCRRTGCSSGEPCPSGGRPPIWRTCRTNSARTDGPASWPPPRPPPPKRHPGPKRRPPPRTSRGPRSSRIPTPAATGSSK